MLGEVYNETAHGGDGGHDEREMVMVAEVDEGGCLMKEISGCAWPERVGCKLLNYVLKLREGHGYHETKFTDR